MITDLCAGEHFLDGASDHRAGHAQGNKAGEQQGKGVSMSPSSDKRVPLACHRCRAKRARCSGDKPVCLACARASEECTWPSGRKRKRTRREMEADERKEREAAAAAAASVSGRNIAKPYVTKKPAAILSSAPAGAVSSTSMWRYPPPAPAPFIWPPNNPDVPQAASLSALSSQTLTDLNRLGETSSERLVRAVESQVAFIEGDPSRQEDLELFYYRFVSNSTDNPGINRIALKLHPRTSNTLHDTVKAPVPESESSSHSQGLPPSAQSPSIFQTQELFDGSSLPLPNVYIPLLDVFFRTIGRHFPSISRKRMEERLETGTMSAFLLNCALLWGTCFVVTHYTQSGICADCAPFITRAQELIIPLLHLPTTDSVTGLLLLAWANYGQNSESGLWTIHQISSRMAIRMALDLGLHEAGILFNSEIYESAAHVVRTRLLFWSLFVTDRILSFSTGRPVSISEEIIEIPLPTDEDMTPDSARNTDPAALQEPVQPTAFPLLVRLMVLCGRIGNVLNGRRGRSRTLVGPTLSTSPNVLGELQQQLVQFYSDLSEPMKWSVEAFQRQEARGHGGVFLTLHLWANAVLALVYHPDLLSNPSGIETPLSSHMDRSLKLSLSSSRLISECLVFADLFSSQSYLASPFVVQPIHVASLAFVYDMRSSVMGYDPESDTSTATEMHSHSPDVAPKTAHLLLTSLARQSLATTTRAIQRMEYYWAGASYVSNVLAKKAAGLMQIRSDPTANKKTFISLPDKGLLRRFTGKNLPHNTAPPTETSLRESLAQEADICSLNDLLSSYSVQGMIVQPADSFDLESLLAVSVYKGNDGAI
ncbi:hypothetical protein FISHEDRAFT_67380 [Fistulina hepatica ATCC 64428]|uniref:Zn(2)-C6 fungal-type domain-containing protein n=1 Tax=Fistulina hepatica ATCC 64428 TaxID=1128425 RepID=A0A0D7A1P4_9AGAR|nr:hypothetical protein FISHEDRAFT_67380 [Fistulina hepatica ATCC 64428]